MLLQSIFVGKRRKLLFTLALALIIAVLLTFTLSTSNVKCQYFSSLEKLHCPPTECPGKDCLCVIGNDGLLYLDGTIGDIE